MLIRLKTLDEERERIAHSHQPFALVLTQHTGNYNKNDVLGTYASRISAHRAVKLSGYSGCVAIVDTRSSQRKNP